jgi:hypothetical protein
MSMYMATAHLYDFNQALTSTPQRTGRARQYVVVGQGADSGQQRIQPEHGRGRLNLDQGAKGPCTTQL